MTIIELDNQRSELRNQVNKLVSLKKKLYSNVDITSPMSLEEKQLYKDIAAIYSQLNTIVREKKKLLQAA